MVNINKIRIFIIHQLDVPYLDMQKFFDCFNTGHHLFVGLTIDSEKLRNELDGTWDYSSYSITNIDQIDKKYYILITPLIEYCGIEHTINGILDIMLDDKLDDNRRFYLESMLYFKSNQKGKKINTLNLIVKHFDDFSHRFSEDIISYEIISNNKDFSETMVIIETYLTEEEVSKKFNKFLID